MDGEELAKIVADKWWTGFPIKLRSIYTEALYDMEFSRGTVIRELFKQLYNTPERADIKISWIDRFFSECMYPLELYEREWKRNIAGILRLLKTERELFEGLPIQVREIMSHKYYPFAFSDLPAMYQNMDFYFATVYLFKGKKDKCSRYIKKLLDSSKINVTFLLRSDEAEYLARTVVKYEDDYYVGGMDYWQEPLSWACAEFNSVFASKDIFKYMMKYKNYLYDIETEHKDLKDRLKVNTAKRISTLCDSIMFETELDIKDLKKTITEYDVMMEEYMNVYRECEEVLCDISEHKG